MKRNKGSRPRTQQRRKARKAQKRARKRGQTGSRVHVIGSYDPNVAPQLHDDCPYCRAFDAIGVSPDPHGEIELTPEQQKEYERHVARFLEEDGLPDGAAILSPEQFQYEFLEAAAELAMTGAFEGVDGTSEAELDRLTARVFQRMRERSLARPPVLAGARN
jgi:hypothetical protein